VDLSSSEDVTDAVLAALADLSTLETLKLVYLDVHDVSAFARSVSLRQLDLDCSAVCDAGIAGLERIPSLAFLRLAGCRSITNVTNLFRSKSLRKLDVSESSVTDAGLVGLELAPALELVDLHGCAGVADAAAVVQRAAARFQMVFWASSDSEEDTSESDAPRDTSSAQIVLSSDSDAESRSSD
jgi:hypothetical protein